MASKEQKKQWLDEAVRHLATLCAQAKQCADESDTLPTDIGQKRAIEVLQTHSHASAPVTAISVNGDIVFSWDNHGDTFKAFVRQNGDVCYFRNKAIVDQEAFAKLTAVPS
jgi:hypothetical protein